MSCLTPRTIRFAIFDRVAADNKLDQVLSFTDDEIREAMINAARAYNSMPPLSIKTNFQCLDDTTDVFIHGTIYWLYLGRVSQLQRNEPDIDAGGVTVRLDQKQIEYFTKMMAHHEEKFKYAVNNIKVAKNLAAGFGTFD